MVETGTYFIIYLVKFNTYLMKNIEYNYNECALGFDEIPFDEILIQGYILLWRKI